VKLSTVRVYNVRVYWLCIARVSSGDGRESKQNMSMRESSDKYESRMQCGNRRIECASDTRCEQGKIDSEDQHEDETAETRSVNKHSCRRTVK